MKVTYIKECIRLYFNLKKLYPNCNIIVIINKCHERKEKENLVKKSVANATDF